MEIAIVGVGAEVLCHAAAVNARALHAPTDAAGRFWDLLALTRSAVSVPLPDALFARTLLVPGDSDPLRIGSIRAMQVVGCGFSPRDTLTLSGVTGAGRLLCLQRGVLTLCGTLLEPQEFPLGAAFATLEPEHALLAAGVRLLAQ